MKNLTFEEAEELNCPHDHNLDNCIHRKCIAWKPEPCSFCDGSGITKKTKMVKCTCRSCKSKYLVTEKTKDMAVTVDCRSCNQTGIVEKEIKKRPWYIFGPKRKVKFLYKCDECKGIGKFVTTRGQLQREGRLYHDHLRWSIAFEPEPTLNMPKWVIRQAYCDHCNNKQQYKEVIKGTDDCFFCNGIGHSEGSCSLNGSV